MQNKRGQGMSINTIVLLILGLLVLVLLSVGFIFGWQKILPWLSKENVDNSINSCNNACNLNSKYEYCSVKRDIYGQKDVLLAEQKNCEQLTELSETKDLGFKKCYTINCMLGDITKICTDNSGTLVNLDPTATPPVTECPTGQTQIKSSDTTSDKICCKAP